MPRTSLLGEYHLASIGTCTALWKPGSIILVGNVRMFSALDVGCVLTPLVSSLPMERSW